MARLSRVSCCSALPPVALRGKSQSVPIVQPTHRAVRRLCMSRCSAVLCCRCSLAGDRLQHVRAGLHEVSDIHCKKCMQMCGWRYVRPLDSQ